MKKTKAALLQSAVALLLCISMLIGTTFAWFSDRVSSGGNIITAGNLDLEMYWTDDLDSGEWYNVEDGEHNTIFDYDKWEPGYTEVRYIKLKNAGSLALNYKLSIDPQNGIGKLAEVINVYYTSEGVRLDTRDDLKKLNAIGLLSSVLNGGATANGTLLAADQTSPLHPSGEVIITLAMSMITSAGNEYQGETIGDGFTIKALATQAPFEKDSFGSDYDADATYTAIAAPDRATAQVDPVDGKVPTGGVTLTGERVSAFIPEGTVLEEGTTELTLTVKPLEDTNSGITVVNNETLLPFDIHIDGISDENTVPVIVDLGEVLPKYLNMGNYRLFHVENGVTNEMTLVKDKNALVAHNQFTYDANTGAVTVSMASFSEVTLVADTANPWNGGVDYEWYGNGNKEEYTIAKADDLAAFSKIVGGMAKTDNVDIGFDSFEGKTVKLVSDINLSDGAKCDNGVAKIFYPIGYNNNKEIYVVDRSKTPGVVGMEGVTSNVYSFEGTFDGNGHTISHFYQNTWDMFGDYNDGYSGTPNYYRDAMGLFGYVVGGTVKNLTIDDFSCDGEFTPTGVVAAYAHNATFENISITNCNPRVYNTGNGGIVGIGGYSSSDTPENQLIFTNITADNTNKISALWGSWDVACGGIMGMFRGYSTVKFTNCHVAAQIDVYNDVCGSYQYYWYRYAGMIIGSLRGRNTTNDAGYTVPDMTGVTAENCTVHFGDWNDYYYCELVANGKASYTHDHRFNRLERVYSVNVDAKTYKATADSSDTPIPTSGRYNYVVVARGENGKEIPGTGNATCYHFVNGEQHKHEDEGYETVNGETVLKEDKQHIYLPFNQLFQGDGWGVKWIALGEFGGVEILDREVADSVTKFEAIGENEYPTETTIKIGELFKAVAGLEVAIVADQVQVFVSPVDENSTAGGIYTPNTADWTEGTLKFTGAGAAKITITDYYYCKATTVIVNITDDEVDKFEIVFPNTDKYIYRVGNLNTVALSSLFKAIDGAAIGNVSVTVTAIEGVNVGGTYTANTSDWTKGTIQFTNTGIVSVTISDDKNATPVTLELEVVDGRNATTANNASATSSNVVLLNDVSGGVTINNGYTLYGNGFAVKDTRTSPSGSAGYVTISNGTVDNVQFVGYKAETQNSMGGTNSADYAPAVRINDDANLYNSYIYGGRFALDINGGNVYLENTVIDGGAIANVRLGSAALTMKNCVTTTDTRGGHPGLGVYVTTKRASLTLEGSFTQYNWLSQSELSRLPNGYGTALNSLFSDKNYVSYRYNYNDIDYVNMGILFISETEGSFTEQDVKALLSDYRNNAENIYGYITTTIVGNTATCYTVRGATYGPDRLDYGDYTGAINYYTLPTYKFDYTKDYKERTDGSDEYCYYDENAGKLNISFNKETDSTVREWDPMILTLGKYGSSLNYTVTMNGEDYTGKTILFAESGEYEIVYTYTDEQNYDVNLHASSVTYKKSVYVTVTAVEPDDVIYHPEFKYVSTWENSAKTIIIDNVTYVMPDVGGTNTNIGSITVNGQTIYYPIVTVGPTSSDGNKAYESGKGYYFAPVFNAINITDYDQETGNPQYTYSSSSDRWPHDKAKANGPDSEIFGYTSNGANPYARAMNAQYYGFSMNSNGLCYTSNDIEKDNDASTHLVQYYYVATDGTTYYYYIQYSFTKMTYSSCVTPDTLITLADGTQKRVDALTGDELLLVWNLETGKYDVAPIVFVDSEEEAEYEIIHLYFSDGSDVKVISEHGFFDLDLGKYVYIDAANYSDYLGHRFVTQGDISEDSWNEVTLDEVVLETEVTTAWSPVTFGHLCYYTNGVLSMPGGIEGLFNIFEVDTDTMRYDEEQMQKDIETYGLFTYEDFDGLIPEIAFEAFNGAYLKVAIGKGLLTWEDIVRLAERYMPLMQ